MSRLSLFITLALLQCSVPGMVRGQTFYFADGRKASLPEAQIKGTNIIVPFKLSGGDGASASLTLPISSLGRIEWPAPAAIAQAEDDLKAGKPADALKKIDAILKEQEPFRDVPGSWWNQGATVKAVALAQLGREAEAESMLDQMRRTKAAPDDISRGELAIIEQLASSGKIDAAKARLDKAESTIADDAGLASISILKGRMFERAGRTEEALLSYLRVPVFYSSEDDKQPAALLGAIRAYRKLGDETRAASMTATLTTRFPNSPEAQSKR
ncbi:MAG: hypothetical protein WC661_16025 [Opitutaceae bacterium]|jgi:tetratricopeptide (TPR) repeat protein